jgi:hypothetical protein
LFCAQNSPQRISLSVKFAAARSGDNVAKVMQALVWFGLAAVVSGRFRGVLRKLQPGCRDVRAS